MHSTGFVWMVLIITQELTHFRPLSAIIMRFEAPKPNNRWDSPLFVVQRDDDLPCEVISDAFIEYICYIFQA